MERFKREHRKMESLRENIGKMERIAEMIATSRDEHILLPSVRSSNLELTFKIMNRKFILCKNYD